jgi:hypothetical protein
MSQFNYISGLSKIIGHVMVIDSQKDSPYEPALYIINEKSARYQGMSFIIALSAMYKYVNPFFKYSEPQLIAQDAKMFEDIKEEIIYARKYMSVVTREKIEKSNIALACLAFAELLAKTNGILLVTGYNLSHCMQMFEIPPVAQAAAQLLLFIENSLDDLRRAPLPFPDNKYVAGGITLLEGGKKIKSSDWIISETDLIKERYENNGVSDA